MVWRLNLVLVFVDAFSVRGRKIKTSRYHILHQGGKKWQAVITYCGAWLGLSNPRQPLSGQCPDGKGMSSCHHHVIMVRLRHAAWKWRAERSWNKPTLARREAIARRNSYTLLVKCSSSIVLKAVTKPLTPLSAFSLDACVDQSVWQWTICCNDVTDYITEVKLHKCDILLRAKANTVTNDS